VSDEREKTSRLHTAEELVGVLRERAGRFAAALDEARNRDDDHPGDEVDTGAVADWSPEQTRQTGLLFALVREALHSPAAVSRDLRGAGERLRAVASSLEAVGGEVAGVLERTRTQ